MITKMQIGFTGTQTGMTHFQKEMIPKILDLKGASEFVFGDCIGADEQAAYIALDHGIRIFTIYPPIKKYKRAFWGGIKESVNDGKFREFEVKGIKVQVRFYPEDDYLKRNKAIVEATNFLIACPKEHAHTLRSGTWATIRHAWKLKKDITVVPPVDRSIDDRDGADE